MNRRELLETACVGTASLLGATTSVAAGSANHSDPPGVAWGRTYDDLQIAAAVPAHDGGYVFVGRGRGRTSPMVPVRVVAVNESGEVRHREEIDPEIPDEANRASADLVRTDDGYAVASGAWFATLDVDLSVEATGFADEYSPNSTTHLTERPDGFVVAAELDRPNHVSVRLFGFDDEGNLRWVREYGEENSKWLEFLLDGPDGGVVVGGRGGDPWLASVADDGTERWQTTLRDAPSGVGYDAVGGDGLTLFGTPDAVRLDTASRSIEWRRTYEPFRDAYGGEIVRPADGGYVVAAKVNRDGFRVGRTDSKGRLQWSHEYAVNVDGQVDVTDLVEQSPGGYLVVGSRRTSQQGWAVLLSESETPTTMKATTSERTATSTTTEITSENTTTSTTASTTDSSTSAAIPGFGVGAALLGTAAGLLARRWR